MTWQHADSEQVGQRVCLPSPATYISPSSFPTSVLPSGEPTGHQKEQQQHLPTVVQRITSEPGKSVENRATMQLHQSRRSRCVR